MAGTAMMPADKTAFVKILEGLATIKKGSLTPEALDIWWLSMAQWSIEDFRAAASHLVTACEFMPTPFDFVKLKRAKEPTAGEAWAQVLLACKNWDKAELLPQGRVARAAKTIGGFRAIGMANIETTLPHIERRFKEAYEELSDVEETREALGYRMPELQEKVSRKNLANPMRQLLSSDEEA